MTIIQKFEPEESKKGFPKKYICLALGMLLLLMLGEIWVSNNIVTYGGKLKSLSDLTKTIDTENQILENEIAKSQSKVGMLPQLILENEKLRKKLTELQQQLPEEKEVSSLLKQVSDLGIKSGLKISFWKPEQKRTHTSGIVYEIPVKVELFGSYHNLGYFFSSLTKLNRIVNLSDIKLSDPKPEKENAIVKVSFTATTFSTIPEEEIGKGK